MPRDLEADLLAAREALCARGWTDADVRHALRKLVDREQLALFDALADDGMPRWVEASPIGVERLEWLVRNLLAVLRSLPSLQDVPAFNGGPSDAVDAALLEKVRALLSKAESTTFTAEADALNAKAQELMARHAIDAAMVAGRGHGSVTARRFLIHDPYARARFALLSEVARACGCEAVILDSLGIAHVFGFSEDLSAVDLLYTSLLLQASTAMAAARPDGRRASAQVAAFRRAFLVAFAHRVGERLAEARRTAVADACAEHGDDVLPVLADRQAQVRAHFADAVPGARRLSQRLSDAGGWRAGQAAGDRASLSTQPTVPTGRRAIGGRQ
ncbi:MAG: DUF2786 domain-containing protein [Acidimicrobiales bacterium]